MTSNTTGTGTTGGGGSASIGQTIKGTAQVIHGMGEKVRGGFLGIVDGPGAGSTHPVAAQGQMETEKGFAALRGTGNTSNTAAAGAGYGAAANRGPTGAPGVGTDYGSAAPGPGGAAGTQYGEGTANTGTYAPSGAGGAPGLNAGAGGGTRGAMPQEQYQDAYQSQTGPAPTSHGGVGVGRNNAGFQGDYGGPQGQTAPQRGGAGPMPDYANSGPGTGAASGGPRRL
ncbi:uncharacterized protein FIBRA_07531 [Fibroporia radiculosa]|uniref:Uncharacterized protein n=1 Tax=Fibroporia radiculosa TaxID=599839 RepID=J4I0U7_9APHY|nr:uncharacterized protein FIBRA_07531 [Fibroporia radiculosa]CCM05317.1 predicted protein [Fibroporia radiculosa]